MWEILEKNFIIFSSVLSFLGGFIMAMRKVEKIKNKLEKIKKIIAQSWQVRGERDYKKIVHDVEKIFL